MNVLVIPEDFCKDQYVLKPIIEAMMRWLGRPRAKVAVCRDPLLGRVAAALDWGQIEAVLDRYQGMIDVYILCIDRDGQSGRRQRLDNIEAKAGEKLKSGRIFLGEHAIEELEVWVLAGHDLDASWTQIRGEISVKERYYVPLARKRGVIDHLFEGREVLSDEAARRYSRVRDPCKEDVQNLEGRLAAAPNKSAAS